MTTLKGVSLEHVEKVLIMAILFDIAAMIAKMAAKLSDSELIGDDEDEAIKLNITGAQSKIAMILECEPADVHLAAELCSDIPPDVSEAARKLFKDKDIRPDFTNEAEA